MPAIKGYTVSDLQGNRVGDMFLTFDDAKDFAQATFPTTSYQIDHWKLATKPERAWEHLSTSALLRAKAVSNG